MKILAYILFAQIIALFFIDAMVVTAPEGWQDKNGFHYGREIESI